MMLYDKLSMQSCRIGPDIARYRVNFLRPDGTVLRTKLIEASSDAEALQHARRLMDGRALDLWDGLRFMEFFPACNEG